MHFKEENNTLKHYGLSTPQVSNIIARLIVAWIRNIYVSRERKEVDKSIIWQKVSFREHVITSTNYISFHILLPSNSFPNLSSTLRKYK